VDLALEGKTGAELDVRAPPAGVTRFNRPRTRLGSRIFSANQYDGFTNTVRPIADLDARVRRTRAADQRRSHVFTADNRLRRATRGTALRRRCQLEPVTVQGSDHDATDGVAALEGGRGPARRVQLGAQPAIGGRLSPQPRLRDPRAGLDSGLARGRGGTPPPRSARLRARGRRRQSCAYLSSVLAGPPTSTTAGLPRSVPGEHRPVRRSRAEPEEWKTTIQVEHPPVLRSQVERNSEPLHPGRHLCEETDHEESAIALMPSRRWGSLPRVGRRQEGQDRRDHGAVDDVWLTFVRDAMTKKGSALGDVDLTIVDAKNDHGQAGRASRELPARRWTRS